LCKVRSCWTHAAIWRRDDNVHTIPFVCFTDENVGLYTDLLS